MTSFAKFPTATYLLKSGKILGRVITDYGFLPKIWLKRYDERENGKDWSGPYQMKLQLASDEKKRFKDQRWPNTLFFRLLCLCYYSEY